MSDAHGGGDKKTASQKVWSAVGVTISVLIGLLVLGFVLVALLPMAGDLFADAIGGASNSIAKIGQAFFSFGTNISVAMSSSFGVFIKIIIYILLFVVGAWILKTGIDKLTGGGHDDHGHGH